MMRSRRHTWFLILSVGACGCRAPEPAAPPLDASPEGAKPAVEMSTAVQPPTKNAQVMSGADKESVLKEEKELPWGLHGLAAMQANSGMEQDVVDSPLSALCDELKRAALAKLEKLPTVDDAGSGGFSPSDWDYCWPTQHGAWAVEPVGLRAVKPEPSQTTIAGHWRVIHVDERKRVTRGSLQPFEATSFSDHSLSTSLFDYDGDGEEEIILTESRGGHSGNGTVSGTLWTFRRGKVAPYPTPFRTLVTSLDLDSDGRPDLISTGGFDGETRPCTAGAFDASTSGAYLVARSLPDGSFDPKGELATEWAKAFCPERPLAFEEEQEEAFASLPSAFRLLKIRCARLWGVSPEAVTRTLDRVCQDTSEREVEDCYGVTPPLCPGMETMQRWAGVDPPFQFQSTRSFGLPHARKLVIAGKQASVIEADGEVVAVNQGLIRLQDESPRCPSDGFSGVEVVGNIFTVTQVACSGRYFILERTEFESKRGSKNLYLKGFSLGFLDRTEDVKHVQVKSLSPQELESLRFQDIDLDQLYDRLLR